MKKTTNIISIVLVLISLSVILFGRSTQPEIRPVVTVYVTEENHVPSTQAPVAAPSEVPVPEASPLQDEYFTFSFIVSYQRRAYREGRPLKDTVIRLCLSRFYCPE